MFNIVFFLKILQFKNWKKLCRHMYSHNDWQEWTYRLLKLSMCLIWI
jgi:hypothetical protein